MNILNRKVLKLPLYWPPQPASDNFEYDFQLKLVLRLG